MTKWVGSMCRISDNTSKRSYMLMPSKRAERPFLHDCGFALMTLRNDNLTEWPCTYDILHSDLKSSRLAGILWEFWRLLIAALPPPFNNSNAL